MKERISIFLKYCLFWLVFFVFARALFLTYHYNLTSELDFGDILLAFLHGLRLDLSAMGYFVVIPGVIMVLTSYFKGKIVDLVLKVYSWLLLLITSFIVVADLELYKHWGFRLDTTPLMYLGKEAAGSGDPIVTVILVMLWLALFALCIWLYIRFISKPLKTLNKSDWKTSVVFLFLTAAMIAPIRGTTGVAPINTGMVYFHESNLFANHSAVNVVWNVGYALKKINRLKYPSDFLESGKTQAHFKKLIDNEGSPVKLLKSKRPNVIVILLESYTFRFIEPLGGIPDVTPNINQLIHEGILFDNFYSSGDRTDKGIVSVLNGYPSQPNSSIIKFPNKTQGLPFLNKNLSKLGYTTEFTYGYNIDYANFRSYLTNAGFDRITHSKDFPEEFNTSKWGVHDHFVFDRFLQEAEQAEAPFFKIMMTQSSHEPYDVPMETVIEGEDAISMFLNSANYTDKSLGEFIESAKKTDWWENTWIIVTADHGHTLPDNGGVSSPNRYKIPMLWLGGALNAGDSTIHAMATQTDIPNTILGQIDIPDADFKFSNNILNPTYDPFAIYIFNNGFGYLKENLTVVYDNTGNKVIEKKGLKNETDLEMGKAYVQTLFNDFNSR